MNKVNQSKVEVEHHKSPKGSFEVVRRHISVALGGKRDIGVWGGGHPFDVELAVIPKGKKGYPYHAHAAQTEYYIFISGSGIFIDGGGQEHAVTEGDHIIVHPGEARQVVNTSDQDLSYDVLADNHRSDVSTYRKTGKRFITPENRCVRVEEADYYLGEE